MKNLLPILSLALSSFAFTSIDLETKSLLNDRLELKIPNAFEIMTEEMMQTKYPSERRPTLVYTNETGGINVALNLTQNQANQANLQAYSDNFVKTFKQIYPSAKWKGNGIKEINGKKVGFLELITPATDTEIYNLMFFTDLDGKLLLCTFNCTEKEMDEWAPIAGEIMNSLKIKDKSQTHASQNKESMFLENESKYNFAETVEKLTAEIEKKTWKVSAVHDLQETLKKSGTEVLPVKVFAICHPKHSSKILLKDDERIVSSLMPCRVSVYEKSNGKTYISRMNAGVLAKSIGGVVEEVMVASAKDVEEMLSSLIIAF